MSNLFELNDLQAVYDIIDDIRTATDTEGFSIVRGAVKMDFVDSLRNMTNKIFKKDGDIRISGNYQRGSEDFQRLDLGEYPASTRFTRFFMFFPWNNADVFSEIARHQIDILNLLSRKDSSFGSSDEGDVNPRRYRMSYLLQYPRGGGFMSEHREYTAEEEGDKAYVVYLALTTRGKDFDAGGAYVKKGEEVIDVEGQVQASDLVIYRGDMYHGVSGIDRDKPVDLDTINGRMMLTSVVRYFQDE